MNMLVRQLAGAERLPGIATRRGIVKSDELALGEAAKSIIDDARLEAAHTLEEARMQAASMIEEAREVIAREREAVAAQAEQEVWRDAVECQTQYERRLALFTEALEEHALDVVRKAFTVLSTEMPAQEKIQSTIRALLSEVDTVPDCTLHVSQTDLEAVQAMEKKIPWPLKADTALPAGDCMLVAERGTWRVSYEGRVCALLTAMQGENLSEMEE